MTAQLAAGRQTLVDVLPALDVAEVRFPDETHFP